MELAKETGLPLAPGLEDSMTVPHTISYAILYRRRINSFHELPKEKQPPRNLWDKPHQLSEFLDTIWDTDTPKETEFIEFNSEDVE